MTMRPWRRLSRGDRDAVAAEALALPLPGVAGRTVVSWPSLVARPSHGNQR